jgi:hypothetical protein
MAKSKTSARPSAQAGKQPGGQVKKETKDTGTKISSSKRESARSFTFSFIPEKYQTPVFLLILLVLIIIFFNKGLFGGKVFSSADNIASGSFNTFLDDAKKEGIFPLWVPYIFIGMPSFAALVPHLERMYDFSHAIWVTARDIMYGIGSNNTTWDIVLFYVIFSFGFYFLAEYKFKNKLIALYCGIAAVFITPIIQMIIVGHNSKLIAVMMFPFVFLFTEKIYDYFTLPEKKNIYKLLLLISALIFCLHVQMSSNHIQMLFYFYLLMGFYLLYRLIYNVIKKTEIGIILKTIGIFAFAASLSGLMYSDSYLSTKEYSKYSIRGVPPITNLAENKNNPAEANDYEYATNWSFSPTEVMTFFIPSWVGFGDVEYKGQMTNVYWGQMPFTTSPMYFGILTILLAAIGIYYKFKKSMLVQVLVVISFISLILSFGRTMPILFNMLFYHLPYFSSFRAPVMIHIIINVAFVILAGIGVKTIMEIAQDKTASAKFLNAGKFLFPLMFLPILLALIGFEGFYSSQISSSGFTQKLQESGYNSQQIPQAISYVSSIAYGNVKSELLVIGLWLVLGYGACYLFIKGKIQYSLFIMTLIVVGLLDLWIIDFKTLNWDNKTDLEAAYKPPDYIDWILKNEKDLSSFRVLNTNKGMPVRENLLAYWRLQSLYGYQGAKLRIYQDMDDVSGLLNPLVWNLTNTKYIIAEKEYSDSNIVTVYKGKKIVLKNKNFLPKAFFVSSYKVAIGLEILNNIKNDNFNPRQVSFFETDPGLKLDIPDSTTKAEITNYKYHEIDLDAEASGNNLMFLSEVYYPAGWKAYIDGNETEIYKTNYVFRSILVPKGKHKIEFKFHPDTYYTGKKISMGSNIILFAIFGVGLGGMLLRKKKEEPPQTIES